jgi:hypothetical protein
MHDWAGTDTKKMPWSSCPRENQLHEYIYLNKLNLQICTRYSKFLFISQLRPQTKLNNMKIIFLLIFFYYVNHLQFKLDLIQKISWNVINW